MCTVVYSTPYFSLMYSLTSFVDQRPILFSGGPFSSCFTRSLRCLSVRNDGLPVCFMASFPPTPLSWKRRSIECTVALFRLAISAMPSMLAPLFRLMAHSRRIFGFALFSAAYRLSNC